jgi:hypothetical protein
MKEIIIILILIILILISKSSFERLDYPLLQKDMLLKVLNGKEYYKFDLMIPKVINKIYIDSTMTLDNIDPVIYSLLDSFKRMNKNYIVKLWSGENCREYLKKNFDYNYINCFDNFIPYAYKADFFRYCLIYNEGGWYSDLKEDILYSLDSINNKNYSFIGIVDLGNAYCLNNFCLQNAFFAAIPKHPLLKFCMERCILNQQTKNYGNDMLEPTGPRLFGSSLENIKSLPENLKLGYHIHDIPGGSHYLDDKKIVIHKCSKCVKGNNWEFGNNYIELWEKKNIYLN